MVIDLAPYFENCSNHNAHPTVMMAIVKTESGGNPLAINLNGLQNGKRIKLAYQPRNYDQAKKWVEYLEKNNYNFDIGIAQVNIKNVHKYGYSASQALDICTNLAVASDILKNNYNKALNTKTTNSQDAVKLAISAYNTGNYQNGFRNGYVSKVVANYYKVSYQDK